MLLRISADSRTTPAQQKLGNRFQLCDFHDEVLRYGGLPLSTLRTTMERWIAHTR